ncbi:TetR/AcrR family transcriptional regulator [Streptomyces sp. WMMC500]|uniref:TetR/AcrR family transcriptional regulator n=1 Tax=Streptomyces sp. WMMC500 TaxID=3015154 RepID=UPI00248C2527|nr:TetR/AcrR family transcriptional regulator [Streptomyces sp. WMMC500]WBB61126.1 TetR/AcrR family transcriptional regulator [Streptomyces sp. WMMC500]
MTHDEATGRPRPARTELPVIGGPPAERADAAQNRRRILAAAAAMVAERGPEALSMDEVAKTAGVGVGTVYRRFGDRAGLAYAVIDDREVQFQTAFLKGPPPLGPGAGAPERIRAFLHALVDRTEDQLGLLLVAEMDSADARFAEGSYELYQQHLALLLGRIRPEADVRWLADALLAPLAANLYGYQRRVGGMSVARVKAGYDELLAGLAPPGGSPGP